MKPFGKLPTVLCLLVLVFSSVASRAEVTASVDRDRVAMGDTLRLTISATQDSEDLSRMDLRPLLAQFEVLQRSTKSSTSLANGQLTHRRQLVLEITPRREGTLKIPPMRVGQHATNMLLVAVGPAAEGGANGQTIIFEAELDRDRVYVQGQLILTLRLQQAVNLEGRSISELQLDNAFVKPLEQKSFQRTLEGRPWLVHEVRYAIFPEQSGTLEIPAQSFSARESLPRRGIFDSGGRGRLVQRSTDPLRIEVLARPRNFPDSTWLPARNLTLEETWSTPPGQLRAGESATRTIQIRGEGLQGAQLPPTLFPATEGLKYYPDQPLINDVEVGTGLLGTRQDAAALVPTRAGSWEIPEIRIPWWDSESGELRYAVLPGRDITVAAADPALTAGDASMPAPDTANAVPAPTAGEKGKALPWKILAIASATGWLATLAFLLRSRRRPPAPQQNPGTNQSEQRAFKQLLAACVGGSALHARQGVLDWTSALLPQATVVSLAQVATLFKDGELSGELNELDAALYSRSTGVWQGSALASTIRRLRDGHHKKSGRKEQELQLYPRAA